MTVQDPTLAEQIAAEAVLERNAEMGRYFEPEILDKARRIVRSVEERDARRAQNPIGNPA